jgi:hypothetical protein
MRKLPAREYYLFRHGSQPDRRLRGRTWWRWHGDPLDLRVPRQVRHSQVELHPASARATRKVLPVMICRAVGMTERKKAGAVNFHVVPPCKPRAWARDVPTPPVKPSAHSDDAKLPINGLEM